MTALARHKGTALARHNSIHSLRKNINVVTMPTHDVLLRHFKKNVVIHARICSCTLLSLMYSWCDVLLWFDHLCGSVNM